MNEKNIATTSTDKKFTKRRCQFPHNFMLQSTNVHYNSGERQKSININKALKKKFLSTIASSTEQFTSIFEITYTTVRLKRIYNSLREKQSIVWVSKID